MLRKLDNFGESLVYPENVAFSSGIFNFYFMEGISKGENLAKWNKNIETKLQFKSNTITIFSS